ncbi:phage tail assembly chaperone [Bradyrhizobium diazoefficiens]
MACQAGDGLPASRGKFYSALRDELRAFAQKTFELGRPEKDGGTWRELLEGLVERTRDPKRRAEYEAELFCPPCPAALAHVWNAFARLGARRASGFGASPISFLEIESFQRLTGLRFMSLEIRLIEELDDLYRKIMSEKAE